MDQDIRIGMARQPEGIRNLDSAEDEFSPAAKPMDIKAVPNSIVLIHELKAHLFLKEIVVTKENHRHLAPFFQDVSLFMGHDQPLSQR